MSDKLSKEKQPSADSHELGRPPEFSAIITSYWEEDSLEEFHARLSMTLQASKRAFEIIIIDDGSDDGTFEKARSIFEKDPHVHTIMRFFKNSGQLAAMTAGICHARGDAVIFIDSDLQLAPEELTRLIEKYDEGFDLVSGFRTRRQDSLFRILPSKVANIIMRKASDTKLRDFGCTFKIYNAKVLRAFDLGPRKLFNTATVISSINRYTEVPVSHSKRRHGKSGWTFRKLWDFNIDNIMNLSRRPFHAIACFSALLALLVIGRIIIEFHFPVKILETVSNGLVLNAILLSTLITVAILCLVGEFTIRSYFSLGTKPSYIIRDIFVKEELSAGGESEC